MSVLENQVFSVAKSDVSHFAPPVSFFSNELSRLLKERTQIEVAAASGLPRSSIAQYASGDRGISVAALNELLRAFPDREDQLALVAAHLQDEIPPSLHGLITIEFPRTLRVEEPSPNAKTIDEAFATLRRRSEEDDDVRKLVLHIADVVG